MPLFGSSKRPRLDGLTREEEKRRDALNPEVMRLAGEKGVAGQAPAAATVLRERMSAEPDEFLWACLLGWQQMSLHRYAHAIGAFESAIERDPEDVRGYFGAGNAYFQAGEARNNLGDAATEDVTPAEATVDNLYNEALRCFRRALEMTEDRSERNTLREAEATVEKALTRKAGRL